MRERKAQIWVETVIYTIIGLTIITIILAIVTPAINKYRDRIVIEQTIDALNNFNEKVLDARESGAGNKRAIELRIKKGSLIVDSPENKLTYILEESELKYSELGEEIPYGDFIIKTEEKGKKYDITLTLAYEDIDITYKKSDEKKVLSPTAVPYKLFAENLGPDASGDKTHIDIRESS